MNIYTINYESLTKNFKPYYDSKELLKTFQGHYIETMSKYKTEMENLMKSSNSLLLDESTQMINQQRFMTLQKEAIKTEQDLRAEITKKQDVEMEKCYNALTKVVGDYSKSNGISLVLSHTSVIFADESLDITEKVREELKTINLYSEEEVEEEVQQ